MSDLIDRLAGLLTDAEIARVAELRLGSVTPPPVPIPVVTGVTKIPRVSHEYATVDPWCLDCSVMLLHHDQGTVFLHYGDGRPYMLLPGVNHSSEPRWSRKDRNLFYYIDGRKLMQFDVSKSWAKAATVVHDFTDSFYTKISGLGESDISPDGESFVFIGDDREIFTYHLSTGKQSRILSWTRSLDSLYITPTRVLVSSPGNGIFLYGHDMMPVTVNPAVSNKIAPAGGHMDVCLQDGVEYLVWMNAADDTGPNRNAALAGCRNGVVRINLATGEQLCLLPDDALPDRYAYSVHVSGLDNKGWCIVETYKSTGDTPLTPRANKILKVKLDGSGFLVLQDLGPGPFDTYMSQPKTAVSHDGSRYCWDQDGSCYIALV